MPANNDNDATNRDETSDRDSTRFVMECEECGNYGATTLKRIADREVSRHNDNFHAGEQVAEVRAFDPDFDAEAVEEGRR